MANPAVTTPTATTVRRRAQLRLGGLGAAVAAGLLGALLVVTVAGPTRDSAPGPEMTGSAPGSAAAGAAPGSTARDDGWDWAGEAALATRVMPALPLQAAQPHTLAARPGGATPRLPEPAGAAPGLPATAAGAVAALAALDEQGLRGGDPAVYAATYQARALPGAPPPPATRLVALLASMRTAAGLAPTGPVAGLTVTYQVSEAQSKGVTDAGRYSVVCVLGQLDADFQGRTISAGVGDCQALRYLPTTTAGPGGAQATAGQWWISPGPTPAPGPDAWPGSQDAATAGYQEVQR
jgi:hypothetical protein